LRIAFLRIAQFHNCDAVILIDAGVDSLLVGDEEGLGTYAEDFFSLLAATGVDLPCYLQCVGAGSEAGIALDDFITNLAIHETSGAYLGCFQWLPSQTSVREYLSAIRASIPTNSSISSVIAAAVEHRFGTSCPAELKARGLNDGEVFIHPIMTFCFFFDARQVLSQRLFVDDCKGAISLSDLSKRFDEARRRYRLLSEDGRYIGRRPFFEDR
jgi:hypothetical protein